jgi:predicted nucleic acid-binding protein
MRRVVVDASVVVKWLLPDREGEENAGEALQILQLIKASGLSVHQPPHWMAEAAAVITRLSADTAIEDIEDLCEMDFEILDTRDVYLKACELSLKLNHHLFDTLYHAVALNLPEAILITADERYYRKAESIGQIMLLENINRTVNSQYKT